MGNNKNNNVSHRPKPASKTGASNARTRNLKSKIEKQFGATNLLQVRLDPAAHLSKKARNIKMKEIISNAPAFHLKDKVIEYYENVLENARREYRRLDELVDGGGARVEDARADDVIDEQLSDVEVGGDEHDNIITS